MTSAGKLRWCWVLLLLLTGGARAETPEQVSRAKIHFEAARALYSLGDYDHALREFTAGYNLVPKPRFLLNIGHSHRKLNQLDKARDAYRKFLAGVASDDPDRSEAQRYLTEVENGLAAAVIPAPVPAPVPPEPPAVPPPAAAPAAPAPSVAWVDSSPPAKKRSKLFHLGWAIPVGVAVVVGLSVGIYFGTRSNIDCTGATLACINAVP